MTTSSDSTLESIGKFTVSILLFAIGFTLRGYVLSTTFNWFVASPFNAPHLTILPAIGVSLVVDLFTKDLAKSMNEAKTDTRDFSAKTIDTVALMLAYLLVLGIAWVLHLFV